VDVLNELRLRPLSETETVACLQWWIGVSNQGNNFHHRHRETWQLLDALVVSVTGPPEDDEDVGCTNILKFQNRGAIIPADGPLPNTLLPTSITSSFDQDVLASVFPWKQLSITDWLRFVTDPKVAAANAEFDVTHSARWAERVLSVLVQAWPYLAETAQEDVIGILSPMSCIPTSTGLKVPNQAYFFSADSLNLLRDLPIVTMPSGAIVEGTLEKVLQSLGVRKYVELQVIFDRSARLIPPSSSDSLNVIIRMIETGYWTTFDLVKYLVSVQATLTPQEFERLRQTSAFPKEGAGKNNRLPGQVQKLNDTKPRISMNQSTSFVSLAYLLLTGVPISTMGVDIQ
jgi:hypothetical protein